MDCGFYLLEMLAVCCLFFCFHEFDCILVIHVMSVGTRKIKKTSIKASGIAVSPVSNIVAVFDGTMLSLWNYITFSKLTHHPCDANITSCTWSNDGQSIVVVY